MGRSLFLSGAALPAFMGLLHLVATVHDVFRTPRFFNPTESGVREAMERSGLGLPRRMGAAGPGMWRAWLGFNISHGLGLLVFGLVLLLVAVQEFEAVDAFGLHPVAVSVTGAYLLISIRFWFYAPTIGTAIALGFFTASWVMG